MKAHGRGRGARRDRFDGPAQPGCPVPVPVGGTSPGKWPSQSGVQRVTAVIAHMRRPDLSRTYGLSAAVASWLCRGEMRPSLITDARASGARVLTGRPSPPSPDGHRPGARESRQSRYCLLWVLVAPLIGFVLAERVFNLGPEGAWELWKAALLGAVLMTPFAIGACLGLRAVLKGFRGGWVGLIANLVLAVLAIGMPVLESLTG